MEGKLLVLFIITFAQTEYANKAVALLNLLAFYLNVSLFEMTIISWPVSLFSQHKSQLYACEQ